MSDCDPWPFPYLETHLIGLGTGWVSSFAWFNKCLLSSFSLTGIDLVHGERLCKGSLGVDVLQEGEPFPGPQRELLSNTREWIVRGDTHADKARDFTGKGRPGEEQEGKGT